MPRRNRRRGRKGLRIVEQAAALPQTYDDMARDLVKRGLATIHILNTHSRLLQKENHR